MRQLVTGPAILLALAATGCSQADHAPGGAEMTGEIAPQSGASAASEAAASADARAAQTKTSADSAAAEPLKVDNPGAATQAGDEASARAPQIAYTYSYGFRVAGEAIPALQQRHADLCESKGPSVCRIISMGNSGGEGDYAQGRLELDVAAPKARPFSRELEAIAKEDGGTPVSASIAGEDLSKQIVDTQARLRARILLRDRLTEILATRKGSVAELVEAERGVAQVNEEIDQAQSWLAEMKGRVSFSRMTVDYSSAAPGSGSFLGPIRDAFGSLGAILGTVIAGLIIVITALIPIGIVVTGIVWAVRRIRRYRRTALTVQTDSSETKR